MGTKPTPEELSDRERIVDCIRRARELGLSVSVSGFGESWNSVAGDLPQTGEPGIVYEHVTEGNVVLEHLRYYDDDGTLAGVFTLFPLKGADEFAILVKLDRQGRGIGTKLLEEAVRRWPIDFKAQRYTLPGAELVMNFLQRHQQK